MNELSALTYELRQDILDIVMAGKGGHIGGDMSVIDALTVLYFKIMNISLDNCEDPDRDYFIMSKGHSVEASWINRIFWNAFPSSSLRISDIRITNYPESR